MFLNRCWAAFRAAPRTGRGSAPSAAADDEELFVDIPWMLLNDAILDQH
jgi:hypothetical protein